MADESSEAATEIRRRLQQPSANEEQRNGATDQSETNEDSGPRTKGHDEGCERSTDEFFWLGIFIILVMICVVIRLIATSCTGFTLLPKHSIRQKADVKSPYFQCEIAYDHLIKLTSFGPRVVGSKENEVLAPKFILSELEKLNSLVPRLRKKVVDIDFYQVDQGTFTLLLLKNTFSSVYRNIGSVVYRIRGRKWLNGSGTKSDALLVNCHYDTVVLSPGAGDNAVSCVVQLEVARAILANSGKSGEGLPEHDIIFLFNGAEENLLQASHAFITKHPWARDIRVFINLDSAGNGGKELVFQTGPRHPWLVWEYAQVAVYPFATVLGQDIFQSGLIPSDTDFRIFRDYGRIPGVDIAYIANGYVYHTMFDTADRISSECVQRAGENLLSLVRGLANSKYLVNHDEFAHDSAIFFDVLGFFMVVYPLHVGTLLNFLTSVTMFVILFVRYFVYLKKPSLVLHAALAVSGCVVFVSLVLLTTAAFVTYVLHKPMTWYALNIHIVGLYVFPSSSGFFLYWYLYSKFQSLRKTDSLPKYSLFNVFYDAVLMVVSSVLLLGCFWRRGSFYLIFMWTLIPFLGRVCFQLFLYMKRSVAFIPRRYHISFFLLAAGIPTVQMFYTISTVFEVFIPILGRSMSEVVPDLLISVLVVLGLLFPFLYLSPWARCTRPGVLRRIGMVFFHCTVAWLLLVAFSKYGRSYSESDVAPRKQRILLVHMNRDLRDDPKRPELVTRHDSGMWVISLDRNKAAIDSADTDLKQHCISHPHEPYCGYPYLYPVAFGLQKSAFIPGRPHHLQPVPRLQVASRTPIGDSAVNMTFLVSGPSHTHIYISVSGDVRLASWSVGDEAGSGVPPLPSRVPPQAKGTHYFIYYSFGGEKPPRKPFAFWAVFAKKRPQKAGSAMFYVALGGQYLFGEGTDSQELKEFLKRTGAHQTSLHLTATYSMWSFDLKSEAAPGLKA